MGSISSLSVCLSMGSIYQSESKACTQVSVHENGAATNVLCLEVAIRHSSNGELCFIVISKTCPCLKDHGM